MSDNPGRTSPTVRFSYAASDIACQLVFAPISFYLLKFYTDIYGLAAGVAGTFPLTDGESRRTMPKVPLRCNMGTSVFSAEKSGPGELPHGPLRGFEPKGTCIR